MRARPWCVPGKGREPANKLLQPYRISSLGLTERGLPGVGAGATCWELALEGAVPLFYLAIPRQPFEVAERTSIWRAARQSCLFSAFLPRAARTVNCFILLQSMLSSLSHVPFLSPGSILAARRGPPSPGSSVVSPPGLSTSSCSSPLCGWPCMLEQERRG